MRGIAIKQFLIILLLFNIKLLGGSTISGNVTDLKSGKPLMGANIILDGTMLGSATDEIGYYQIKNVPIGSYTLRAMFIGYETLEKSINVESDQDYVINLKLNPSAIELKETRVTAERRKDKVTGAPASINIITSREIKRKNTTNMGAYLKGLKGVDFTSSGINNYSISIRGFNSSFNTRLLTLSDGRVANIPALRVINYSTLPQSLDDVEKIEVVLGPATALYGANAHSGVVNIISKPPALSEGFTMSISGSNDDRQLRKINGRFAANISKTFSMKISGSYLHAYDWAYISETEYKRHLYPWIGTPFRTQDGRDNNPSFEEALQTWEENSQGVLVLIGDGEPMDTGDPDGDGVMGEDWYNGYDDDGDGLIDEDYFEADGIDNDEDCTADTNEDGCFCCIGDFNVDENIDLGIDNWFDGVDNDNNGVIDDEGGNESIESIISFWGGNIDNENILINWGRRDSLIGGEVNPYYLPDAQFNNQHVFGDHRYNEQDIRLEFDIFIYDFGMDGIPGDPWEDVAGDGEFQLGEPLNLVGLFTSAQDVGLDGIPNTGDFGEGDGIWQPGDGWIDENQNGIVDYGLGGGYDTYETPVESDYNDVWPLLNGIWNEDEVIYDCGNDGYCWGDNWTVGEPYQAMDVYGNPVTDANGNPVWIYGPDPGEGDGGFPFDYLENDGIFDIGDGIFGYGGDTFNDYGLDGLPNTEDAGEGDGIWNEGENFNDLNGDGKFTPPDIVDNYQFVTDNNGDGLSDYPDFEIDNRKVELRLDFDPDPDINLTLQTGYSWTKTQQVTGTGRYLADGFEYKYYQLRGRYKNWFSQFYMNQSYAGDTRGYNLGNVIIDKSKNYAYQIQHNSVFNNINTKFVWGLDYFKTQPYTYGTILNDGPNGYDNDGDWIYTRGDGIDNDLDGLIDGDDDLCLDGSKSGYRFGRMWRCEEGIDEPDEFIDPVSNEYGFYYQTTTELFGTSRYELITAARFDYHDLLAEGILVAPKLGFIYKPDDKSSMRFTYGKAHNTPSSITLFTDIFIGKVSIFDVFLRGNKDGTAYCRVGEPCLGEDYPTSVVIPGFYSENGNTFFNISTDEADYFSGDDYSTPYTERVNGAPYFFKFPDAESNLGGDMLPIDTANYVIYIPELNGEGVLYTPEESFNIPDVEPIKTEKIQTLEFGYKGFLGGRTHFTLDYYLSYYEDFFSPPTIITPWVVRRMFDEYGNDITNIDDLHVSGLMTINDFMTFPPYGTAWNGLDEDGDWLEWADEFGWWDDKNGDGDPADPGEWGFVLWDLDENFDTTGYTIYHPWEALELQNGPPEFNPYAGQILYDAGGKYDAVGIDEWHGTVGLAEYELAQIGLLNSDGELILAPGKANAPPDVILSPMNYGEVWMQGIDIGITQILSEKLILDGNFSWYGTTEFYNELTKKNDPINAPKFKWNAGIKWDSPLGNVILNFRYVDQFRWSDGIWAGNIGPYNILDLYYTYSITKNLEFNLSALNINNDLHRELVGGAIMGRQIVMRFTSAF